MTTWQDEGWDEPDPSSWGFVDRVYAHEEGREGVTIATIHTDASSYEQTFGPEDTVAWWYERLSVIHRAACALAEADDDGKQRVREALEPDYSDDPLIYDRDVTDLAGRAQRIINALDACPARQEHDE